MRLTSSAFTHQSSIPSLYTCDGQNKRPPLSFEDIPSAARSLALIVDDPDAPMGPSDPATGRAGTWLHWTAWNIPPSQPSFDGDSLPAGTVEGMTSVGKPGYGGPCPPSGTHHYFFRGYALDISLNLPAGASREQLEKAMKGHIIAQTELVGLYARQKK